jgi:uncharacterized protein (TIGR02246 family)
VSAASAAAEARFRAIYRAFNDRDADRLLTHMTDDVDWPNAWEGGRVRGREAVREYWDRQWATIDPRVEPERVRRLPDGRVEVEVRQTVRALDGTVLSDGRVCHTYACRAGLIARMDVSEASAPDTP